MLDFIKVKYKTYSFAYNVKKLLKELKNKEILSFDIETQGVENYDKVVEAGKILKRHKKSKTIDKIPKDELQRLYSLSENSGLSNPRKVKVTHFIFGLSEDEARVVIINSKKVEYMIWDFIVNYEGLLIIHNASFDLRILYQRTNGKFVKNFEDTRLMVKCLVNDANTFKSLVGLKVLMKDYYDPDWCLLGDEGYNITNYKDPSFLRYCAIDGCATFKLYELVKEKECELKHICK